MADTSCLETDQVATKAQAFCRANRFDYADAFWTSHDYGTGSGTHTEFLCMHNGDTLTRPANNYDITVHQD